MSAPARLPAPRKPMRVVFMSRSCRYAEAAQRRTDLVGGPAGDHAGGQVGTALRGDPDGLGSDAEGAFDVRHPGVPDVDELVRAGAEPAGSMLEDARVGLLVAEHSRVRDDTEEPREPHLMKELCEAPLRVRHDAERDALADEVLEQLLHAGDGAAPQVPSRLLRPEIFDQRYGHVA